MSFDDNPITPGIALVGFDSQPWESLEILIVSGDKRQLQGQRDGRDVGIVDARCEAVRLHVGLNLGTLFHDLGCEGYYLEGSHCPSGPL